MNRLKKIIEAGGSISDWNKARKTAAEAGHVADEAKGAARIDVNVNVDTKRAADEVSSQAHAAEKVETAAKVTDPVKLRTTFQTKQRDLVEELEAAMNPQSLSSKMTSLFGSLRGVLSKGGAMGHPYPAAAHAEKSEIPDILKRMREHMDSDIYKDLPSAPSGARSPRQTLDDLHKGLRVDPDNFRQLSKKAASGTVTPWWQTKTPWVGALALSAGMAYINGTDSKEDINDNNLSFFETITYNAKKTMMGVFGIGTERFIDDALAKNKNDPIALALKGNREAIRGDSSNAIATADAARLAANAAAANLAPPTDLKAALSIGSKTTESSKQEVHTFDPAKLEDNLNHLVEDSYIRPDEKAELLAAWKAASKTTSPAEVFQGNAIDILSKSPVGRDKEAVDYVSKMVLGQNVTPNQSR